MIDIKSANSLRPTFSHDAKMSSYSANSINSYNENMMQMQGTSSFSIENRDVKEQPVYLGNLIRLGHGKKGSRSM